MLYFCERNRRQMRCTHSGGWSVGGERRQSPGNHRWGRSYVFAASHLMYLWLLLLYICGFSCYIFATSLLMYFQLHLLSFCGFSSYVFSTSPVMYLRFPLLLCYCDNFQVTICLDEICSWVPTFQAIFFRFKSFSILHPTYDNMYQLKITSVSAILL